MDDVRVNDFTVGGKCSNCGACCSGVLPIAKADVDRIKAYLRAYEIREQRREGRQGVDLTCPFRDEMHKKCLIYEVRPAICRQFMCNYTIDDLRAAKRFFHDRHDVVFMRGEFFGNREVENYIAELNGLARQAMGGGKA